MSRFSLDTTVGAVVAAAPATSRVFQRLGIDFCCGGKVALGKACEGKGIAPAALLAELDAAAAGPAAGPDLSSEGLEAIVDYVLDRHHTFVKREVPRLSALMEKVVRVHGERHPDTLPELGRVWRATAGHLMDHLGKEENVLFPWIRAVASGRVPAAAAQGIEGPISVMEAEHEDHGANLARIRELAGGFVAPADACGSWLALWGGLAEFEADVHQHVHVENNVLFPKVREAVFGR